MSLDKSVQYEYLYHKLHDKNRLENNIYIAVR